MKLSPADEPVEATGDLASRTPARAPLVEPAITRAAKFIRRGGSWAMRTSLAGSLDLACTLCLVAIGASHGGAHLLGAIVGYLALLAIMASSVMRSAGRAQASIAIAFFALALRGGAVSSAIGLGMPGWLSDSCGVAIGWALISIGQQWRDEYTASSMQGLALSWLSSAPVILVVAVLLRIVYIDVIPLLPEEAYYWNYAANIDIGYLDHPPLVAWAIAVGERLVGSTGAGIRFGAFLCGLITLGFVYRLARRLVDRDSALMAAALAAALPFFFSTGVLMTPDALLIAAWSASLYFFHRALVLDDRTAWLWCGAAVGVGLLSKYTIALLGLAALAFLLLDRRSRRWLTRWEPYVAAAISLALFTPVIIWNYQNDWVSFMFQASDRFGETSSFNLHVLVMNLLMVATPIPLIALRLLFVSRWTHDAHANLEPEHATARNRLFVACFVFAPLLVFCWSALRHEPRLNWTAPIWLALLPLAGWTITNAGVLRKRQWRAVVYRLARPLPMALLMANAILVYYVALGIPGIPYPTSSARTLGWTDATRHIQQVHDRLTRASGNAPIVVGMDKYFTASQLSYHATRLVSNAQGRREGEQGPMKVAAKGAVFGGNGLMFKYWSAGQSFAGRSFIMVSRNAAALESESLAIYFRVLDTEIQPLPMVHDGPGADGQLIARYYYRIGHDYRPAKSADRQDAGAVARDEWKKMAGMIASNRAGTRQ